MSDMALFLANAKFINTAGALCMNLLHIALGKRLMYCPFNAALKWLSSKPPKKIKNLKWLP